MKYDPSTATKKFTPCKYLRTRTKRDYGRWFYETMLGKFIIQRYPGHLMPGARWLWEARDWETNEAWCHGTTRHEAEWRLRAHIAEQLANKE